MGCNVLRIIALARSVFGISTLLAVSIFPATALAQGSKYYPP